ncbi:MAG TPA: MBL fold metallo-hydrolase, partial [Chitinophagaceae bacterium]|nr:MBL fold metallo-hydrolase [Chitinophagaceae bacterium]
MENNKESTGGRSSFPDTGSLKIIPLSEGSFTIDKTKMFVPFNEAEDNLQDRAIGSLLVEVQPFAVVTAKDVLLLDAGLGFNDPRTGQMQILANLERAGIRADQVTKVLMSHLHKDHAGGISIESDHSRLTFPNATYYIQRRELEYAFYKGRPSFITSEL